MLPKRNLSINQRDVAAAQRRLPQSSKGVVKKTAALKDRAKRITSNAITKAEFEHQMQNRGRNGSDGVYGHVRPGTGYVHSYGRLDNGKRTAGDVRPMSKGMAKGVVKQHNAIVKKRTTKGNPLYKKSGMGYASGLPNPHD